MATVAQRYTQWFFDDGEPRSDLSPSATLYFTDSAGLYLPLVPIPSRTSTSISSEQLDVVAAARTITRTVAASWTASGFAVGDWVQFSDFANAGNNTVGKIESITGGTSEILTLEDRPTLALVNETGSGDEDAFKLIPGVFYALTNALFPGVIAWDAGVSLIGDTRIKYVRCGGGEPVLAGPLKDMEVGDSLNRQAGTAGERWLAAADKIYTRIENASVGKVNGRPVVTYAEIAYYEDDTFTTLLLRTQHTPTYDPTHAILTDSSNAKA